MTDKEALRRLAANLRTKRQAAGLSMSALARQIGDYPATIKRIEDEVSQPGVGLLTRIAEALSVTVNDLLDDTRRPADRREKILSHTS